MNDQLGGDGWRGERRERDTQREKGRKTERERETKTERARWALVVRSIYDA